MNYSEKSKAFLENLDVYIVSHGGVSTNYIHDLLAKHKYRVGDKSPPWNLLCHAPRPYSSIVKTLYIHGDYANAIVSQHKRNFLRMNMNKLRMEKQTGYSIEEFIRRYPNDPMGIKEQFNNFVDKPNVWVLRYPYTKDELLRVFESMDLRIDPETVDIKPRQTHVIPKHLKALCQVYENWQ